MNAILTIEERLNGDIRLALTEGSLYFERAGSVWKTLRRVAALLDQLQVPYAVVGSLAMFLHGYRRFTHNINLLVAPDGLSAAAERLSGFQRMGDQSKRFIDGETGVSVLFRIEGDPPGGIAWRQIRFPHPLASSMIDDGLRFVSLPTLISLKLAAGLSNRDRLRDIADVQEMIKELCLVESLRTELHPDVRENYTAICRSIDDHAGPFLKLWDWAATVRPRSIEQMISLSGSRLAEIEAMQRDGVRLFESRPYYENAAVLATNDRVVARKYDMHHESEHLFKD
jgi:hypothetical protein